MTLPSTEPLDGDFWYILDSQGELIWKPCSALRGEFYLSWLGQGKNVVGAGLIRMRLGKITDVCVHGTPYYWLQPHKVLPLVVQTLKRMQVGGSDTMRLDYHLAGWGMRDTSQASVEPRATGQPAWTEIPFLSETAINLIAKGFRSEHEAPDESAPAAKGLLGRVAQPEPSDSPTDLLTRLDETLGPENVAPVLVRLLEHDLNVTPAYRQASCFESIKPADVSSQTSSSPGKLSRLVISAIYHLAPQLNNQQLSNTLLLNSLRQRHPFDVTWGANFLVKCFGMSNLIRLLQVAVVKEKDGQVRGNVLDLLQELGYGFSVKLGGETLAKLTDLLEQESLTNFSQVIRAHLDFIQTYIQQSTAN